MPLPPMDFPLARGPFSDVHDRKSSMSAGVLKTPQMRSQRLIGNSNPRYQWYASVDWLHRNAKRRLTCDVPREQYWKTDKDLKAMKKPL